MKLIKLSLGLLLSVIVIPASANSFDVCLKSAESATCQSYLEGVVDGALMYRDNQAKKRIDPNNYESRALKYRAGKRYQTANVNYCSSHILVKSEVVSALTEQVALKNVSNSDELESVITTILDCPRPK
ncbi:hypothetical protein [Shewanella saliphila]|uniref:Rap1a immunity protein domain-containing protein n=1 Tax=Shewanella saliphila TaxID=2282698 RepID=A0ABQ2Q1V1_9GAMM|nr:hypothetical protein [Shewanella saliphila]MCL1100511.1 hypothetical protein [Shewanella saliphila]GGP40627.1 hypothetical protein GCM10009409_04380 [Shewanella saliphila]